MQAQQRLGRSQPSCWEDNKREDVSLLGIPIFVSCIVSPSAVEDVGMPFIGGSTESGYHTLLERKEIMHRRAGMYGPWLGVIYGDGSP